MKTTMLRPLPAVIAAAFAIGCAAPPKPTSPNSSWTNRLPTWL